MLCLTKEEKDQFLKGVKSGEINPDVINGLTSTEARESFFAKYIPKDRVKDVVTIFEKKMLLKNQQAGIISAVKETLGLSKTAQRDFITKVENLDKALSKAEIKQFLGDLIEKRLGFGVTEEQFKNISKLTKDTQTLKAKANKDGIFLTEQDALSYGFSQRFLENYVQMCPKS